MTTQSPKRSSTRSRSSLAAPVKPFMPRRQVPFRHPDFSDDQIQRLTEGSALSRDRLLQTLRRMDTTAGFNLLPGPTLGVRGAVSPATSPSVAANNDREVISLLMARLVRLEAKLAEAHRQLQHKEHTITQLEDQVAILQQARSAEEGDPTALMQLEQTCIRLQNQTQQMERFLAEYGMAWVGEKRFSTTSTSSGVSQLGDDSSSDGPSITTPNPSPTGGDRVNYDCIISSIRDLNLLAGDGVAQVCLSPEGATLKRAEPVPLTLFADGIAVGNEGPFRNFSESSTRRCLQELAEGYFPSDYFGGISVGTPILVTDRRFSTFDGPKSPREPLSIKQFLDSLPNSVVRDGRLMDVRRSIEQLLQVSADTVDVIPVATHVPNPAPIKGIVTLRIRSETGNETFLLKLYPSDTIGDIRKCLDFHRARAASVSGVAEPSTEYDILSLCPRKIYNALEETLSECDLAPNAALYLRSPTPHLTSNP